MCPGVLRGMNLLIVGLQQALADENSPASILDDVPDDSRDSNALAGQISLYTSLFLLATMMCSLEISIEI